MRETDQRTPRGLLWTGLLSGGMIVLTLGVMNSMEWIEENRQEEWNVAFIDVYTNDDGIVNDPGHDPRDTGIDPGYDKHVASCSAEFDPDIARIRVSNGYPSYTCHFWAVIRNTGLEPVRRGPVVIRAPAELTIREANPLLCLTLDPGEIEIETFSVHVEQPASYASTYVFSIEKPFGERTAGTIGFWKNWDSHGSFTADEIEAWLVRIDAASDWLGPRTIAEMQALFDAARAGRGAMEDQFLAQYLATRLNGEAALLCTDEEHDVSAIDRDNYLGLGDPAHASLAVIVEAIEAKSGTNPTAEEFEIMKDVCDGLNRLDI